MDNTADIFPVDCTALSVVRLVRDKTTQTPSKTKCNDKKADKKAVKAKGTQTFLTKDTFTERLFTCVCSKSTGTQTVLPKTADENPSLSKDQLPILVPVPPLEVNSDPVNEYSNLSEDDKSSDDEFELNSDDSDEDSQVSSAEKASDEKLKSIVLSSSKPPQEQKKFIVFEEALVKCFETCFKCKSPCAVVLESTIGTFCQISVKCSYDSNHCFSWSTGPIHNRLPLLHLMITSGILASGLECSKVLQFFDSLKIKCFTRRQFSTLQSAYATPAVFNVWGREKAVLVQEISGTSRCIASDMRVDSPGHSGLFGSGSSLDMEKNVILDTQIIKVL